jgi:SAM-dependent methyltransferase
MGRRRRWTLLLAAGAAVSAAATVAVARHIRGGAKGREAPGGILIGDARRYDSAVHRLLLGSFFDGIAAYVAVSAPGGVRVLEVGCGPGHLAIRLARRYGLDVSGVDLDPAMIERARANARTVGNDSAQPEFLVGDVASLPFPDGSFDLVVSTLSMHHWADQTAGLAEIGRVLGTGGRALVWDLRPGRVPFHRHVPDALDPTHGTSLRAVTTSPWRWPWRFTLTQRTELVRAMGGSGT